MTSLLEQLRDLITQKRTVAYWSMRGLRKWKFLSNESKLAKDWTKVIGIMKKDAMKKMRNPTSSRREFSSMYGIDRLSQQTSRASGAQSVNQHVESLLCCVCAHTAAPHRELNDTNPAFITHFSFARMWYRSVLICQNVNALHQKHLASLTSLQM